MRLPLGRLSFPALLLSALACGACGGSSPPPAAPASAAATLTPPSAPPPKPADHPESDKVSWKKDSPVKNCHMPAAGSDLTKAVTAMAAGCIDATKMHQVGPATTGEGTGGVAVKTIELQAKANHCYRAFGLAEPTVTDFDIAIMDSAGKSAGEDLTDSNDAITLEDGSICFKQDDTVNVNTAVAAGKGKWAVEVWSD